MCTVSMIYDHYYEKWQDITKIVPTSPGEWCIPPITPAEIAEFRQLLERARKYDIEHNQPDCELKEKREKLLKLADELGVRIDFL